MSQDQLLINGDLLRLRREARGWVLNDMATRACMSVKQIRQLEEGGMSSFYSEAVKVTAAKKVGALLGLSADEVFAQNASVFPESELDASASLVGQMPVDVAPESERKVEPEISKLPSAPSVSLTQESKSKTSLWVVAGLFVAALMVAAYLQPQDESVAEPAPPLQIVPTDAADSVSAASSVETSATELAASSVITAGASRVVSPIVSASAPVAFRTASSSVVVTPIVSAASK